MQDKVSVPREFLTITCPLNSLGAVSMPRSKIIRTITGKTLTQKEWTRSSKLKTSKAGARGLQVRKWHLILPFMLLTQTVKIQEPVCNILGKLAEIQLMNFVSH
mmetsp:Transcript_15700/g.23795  ORF Transcript_15700/g.23795 Transcript_15700/m.23795 type:complete len:104 (+) Transcript_15700:159-470(+)